ALLRRIMRLRSVMGLRRVLSVPALEGLRGLLRLRGALRRPRAGRRTGRALLLLRSVLGGKARRRSLGVVREGGVVLAHALMMSHGPENSLKRTCGKACDSPQSSQRARPAGSRDRRSSHRLSTGCAQTLGDLLG